MDLWNTPEIKKAIEESEKRRLDIPVDEKERREWIADHIEIFGQDIDKWKYDAMEIRADLIMTREKLANLYLVTGIDDILPIMGDLYRAIERLKAL